MTYHIKDRMLDLVETEWLKAQLQVNSLLAYYRCPELNIEQPPTSINLDELQALLSLISGKN